ncbi:MAG: alcohol dehydrogenase catalytic domain-containing protein [Bacteroides sp.]|nr:alcohol dehydrogenase catalytic domain-containing protein [Bacteroides sp.]
MKLGDNDIQIEILYAGICHSNLHTVWKDNSSKSNYPMVPGQEIA